MTAPFAHVLADLLQTFGDRSSVLSHVLVQLKSNRSEAYRINQKNAMLSKPRIKNPATYATKLHETVENVCCESYFWMLTINMKYTSVFPYPSQGSVKISVFIIRFLNIQRLLKGGIVRSITNCVSLTVGLRARIKQDDTQASYSSPICSASRSETKFLRSTGETSWWFLAVHFQGIKCVTLDGQKPYGILIMSIAFGCLYHVSV